MADPVEREDHDSVYRGEHTNEDGDLVNEGVGDLHYKRGDANQVLVHFAPSLEELQVLTRGGHIEIGIYVDPIPPIHVTAIPQEGK